MTKLPKFDAPPVIETVMGVQFAPLPDFTGAMSGWFWKSYLPKLGGNWPKSHDALPLQDQFERFDGDAGWVMPGFQFVGTEATRTQLIRDDEERMVQIQYSRFLLNWKRVAGRYPSYDALLPEFLALLEQFSKFTRDAGYGPLGHNQWEITYVNMINRGEMWNSFADIEKIFTKLAVFNPVSPLQAADTLNVNWRYIIGSNKGRLHISVNHVRTAPDNQEALRLQLTARGPLNSDDPEMLRDCLSLGHEAIVNTFAAITTDEAQRFWKRTQ